MIEELTKQLKGDEGFRSKPYRDTVGKLTIGIGRNLDDVGISENEAELLLWNDLSKAVAELKARLPWATSLNEPRQGVLINMAFNMGISSLLLFVNMLAAAQAGDFDKAAEHMEQSRWASQVGPRAQRLILQMRYGVWHFAPEVNNGLS